MDILRNFFGVDEEKVEEPQIRAVTIPEAAEYVQYSYFRDFKTEQLQKILASVNNETTLKILNDISIEQKQLEKVLKEYEDQKENWRQYYAKLFSLHKSSLDGIITKEDLKKRFSTIVNNQSNIVKKLFGTIRTNRELSLTGSERKTELDKVTAALEELLEGRDDKSEVFRRVLGSGDVEVILNRELAIAYSREQRYAKLYKKMTKKMRTLLQRKYEAMDKFDDNNGTIISLQGYIKEADNFLTVHESRGRFLTNPPIRTLSEDEANARRAFNRLQAEEKEAAVVDQRNILSDILYQGNMSVALYEEPDIENQNDLAYVLKQGITMFNNLHVVPWDIEDLTPENAYDIFMVLTLQVDSIVDQSILTGKLFSFYMLAAHYANDLKIQLDGQPRNYFTYEVLRTAVSRFLRKWVFDLKSTELESFYDKAKYRTGYQADYIDGLVEYFVTHMDEHINEVIGVLEKKKEYFKSARASGVAFTEQPVLDVKLKF